MTQPLQAPQKLTATNFDLPSLHLLRPEIAVTLHDAEMHLGEFNDDIGQAPLLLDSVETLAQVAKVLRLISLEEGAVLAHALSQGFQKLYDDNQPASDELVMDISEGIMTLNRYIEFVLLKETPEPSLILPIINTLHGKLGQPTVTLNQLTDAKTSSLVIANPEQNFQSLQALGLTSQTLVDAYRAGLIVALQATTPPTDSQDLAKLKAMQAACEAISARSDSLFWQAADAAVSNLAPALPLTNQQKRALIFVEQQFKDYQPINDPRFADLVRFASSRDGALAQKVQQKFSVNTLDSQQLASMKRFLFGPDREVTDTLNTLIQQEIDAVKTASDNYARQENLASNEAELPAVIERLQALSSVFKTLNLQSASRALTGQVEEVKGWSQPKPEDFDKLLSSLMVAENAAIYLAKSHTPGATSLPLYNQQISLHQLDTAYSTLIRESRSAVAAIENAFNDYLADPNHDIMNLTNVPEMMRNISGACQFLRLNHASQLLKRASGIMETLVTGSQSITTEQLAKIADVVMAVDYYLESLEVNKPAGANPIKIGQKSLHDLMAA